MLVLIVSGFVYMLFLWLPLDQEIEKISIYWTKYCKNTVSSYFNLKT